jgi:cytochrome c biogenesis protein
MGAANKVKTNKELRNVGPSITYKLRDAAGQAKEFHNYMLPIEMGDGASVYLFGARETPADPFRYLRIPADEKGGLEGFFNIRNALSDPALRELAVSRYAKKAADPARPEMVKQLTLSASRALSLFAGADKSMSVTSADSTNPGAGLQAVANFIEANVPEAERAKAGEVLVRILNGALFELTQITREQAGLKPLELTDATQAFMTQTVLSLSDASFYPAPMVFTLKDFTQVQASVFQVARAPGKNVVYLGCAFLILGVFAMLYVRERRVWVWLTPAQDQSGDTPVTQATMALSTNRKTMDGDREFGHLTEKLIGVKPNVKSDLKQSRSAPDAVTDAPAHSEHGSV